MITTNSVEIDMMQRQLSKKKLERLAIQGGDFSAPGQRGERARLTAGSLRALLEDEVKLAREGARLGGARDISQEELEYILDRGKVFSDDAAMDGEMYDIVAVSNAADTLLHDLD